MNIDEKITARDLLANLVKCMTENETDTVLITVPTAAGNLKFEVVLVTTEEDLDFSKAPDGSTDEVPA